jgi:DNA modification methylase
MPDYKPEQTKRVLANYRKDLYELNSITEDELKQALYDNCKKFSFEEALATFNTRGHPSIYYCNCDKGVSPRDAWYDDKLLKRAINTQIQYRPDDLSIKMTIARFTIARIAQKPTMFTSSLMESIIKSFCKKKFGLTIVDPFAGFSGRGLGAKKCNAIYTGYDINEVTIKEDRALGLNVTYRDVLTTHDETKYDVMISCPPYNLIEQWGQPIENKSSLEWARIAKKAYPNVAQYIFVVDTIDEECTILKEIGSNKKDHFQKASASVHNKEWVIQI